jgi:sulfite reductase alpha subunit-like flavoprotein
LYLFQNWPQVHKGRIHVTAVVVEYKTSCGRVHKGVCTNWLKEQIPQGDVFPVVPVFVRKSSFHLPAQLKNPIMMIGPGTGLAPFRGFLQEREFRAKKNNEENSVMSNDLFFGCRTRDADFLYKEEIEGWVDNKAITQLHLAVSREGTLALSFWLLEAQNTKLTDRIAIFQDRKKFTSST